jgi:hypothetical protein
MWIVGILRHGEFHPLRESPGFREPLEAKAWAHEFLKKNPGILPPDTDCLTWRLSEDT